MISRISSCSIDSATAGETDRAVAVHSHAPVLISSAHADERGSWARSIHSDSCRANHSFVEVDCGPARPVGRQSADDTDNALPAEIRHQFRQAAGGTLFLDRIDLLSAAGQADLMSLLTEQAGHAGGPGGLPDRTSPRIIAGASRSLLDAVSAGAFDRSLFYRLNVIHLDLATGHREREPLFSA